MTLDAKVKIMKKTPVASRSLVTTVMYGMYEKTEFLVRNSVATPVVTRTTAQKLNSFEPLCIWRIILRNKKKKTRRGD